MGRGATVRRKAAAAVAAGGACRGSDRSLRGLAVRADRTISVCGNLGGGSGQSHVLLRADAGGGLAAVLATLAGRVGASAAAAQPGGPVLRHRVRRGHRHALAGRDEGPALPVLRDAVRLHRTGHRGGGARDPVKGRGEQGGRGGRCHGGAGASHGSRPRVSQEAQRSLKFLLGKPSAYAGFSYFAEPDWPAAMPAFQPLAETRTVYSCRRASKASISWAATTTKSIPASCRRPRPGRKSARTCARVGRRSDSRLPSTSGCPARAFARGSRGAEARRGPGVPLESSTCCSGSAAW